MNFLQLNFFTIGSLIGTIFAGFSALFFLRIPDRSKATFHLGMTMLSLGTFHLGYVWGFLSDDPSLVYHRWLVIWSAMYGSIHATQFYLHYPKSIFPKLRKVLFWGQYALAVAVEIYFIVISYGTDRLYYFNSHYWDFTTAGFYKFYALFVLFFFFIAYFTGFWATWYNKTRHRWTILTITFALILLTFVPAILNALSRDGAVHRSTYQTMTDLLLVVALFIDTVVYINSTKDKSSLMGRIVSITLATFLLVFQMLAYVSLTHSEENFNESTFKDAKLVVDQREHPDYIQYVSVFDAKTSEFRLVENKEGLAIPNFKNDEADYQNSLIRAQIESNANLSPDEFRSVIIRLIQNTPDSFSGYAALIRSYFENHSAKEWNSESMLSYVDSFESKLLYRKNKFLQEKADWQNHMEKLFPVQKDSELTPFFQALHSLAKGEKSDEQLQASIVSALSPFYTGGRRLYRGKNRIAPGEKNPDKYVSFHVVDLKNSRVYEVGASYTYYRTYIHRLAFQIVLMLAAVTLVVIFLFRYFFSGVLLNPLGEVVEGLSEVNSGNLDYRLSVHVEDEIGYLARSFNRMVRSIKAARKRLQQYADELEQKVQDRTKELRETLDEVQSLKEQQDGDYFLTSLLIKPLQKNRAFQSNVRIEFFFEQKKKFSFKEKEEEIGGDINISNHLLLQGREYSVFLNADAMGKSMQGAGGALVLGSVFEAMIERTKMTQEGKEQSPERWVKNAFLELHKVFETFDGSMLISLVMGLVDENSGLIYYINAEHPWTVLYRDGIASFIENELLFRKLGTPGMGGQVFIRTFQMEPGDVIIAGSDGRDDLLLSSEADGTRIINEDEMLFLRIVEEGKGDLEGIYDAMLHKGELTDDLSLLKISFQEDYAEIRERKERENWESIQSLLKQTKEAISSSEIKDAVSYLEEAESLNSELPQVKKKLIKLYMELKDYSKAMRTAEKYSQLEPVNTDILYVASYCARKAGDVKKAIDFGERVRLREPDNLKNLINLVQAYISQARLDRASSLVSEILESEPDNVTGLKMKDFLEGQGVTVGKA